MSGSRLTYNDYNSTFQDVLSMDNSVNIYQRNLQVFATVLYKVLNNLSPDIVRETVRHFTIIRNHVLTLDKVLDFEL